MLLWYSEETTHPPYVTLRNKKIPELLPNCSPEYEYRAHDCILNNNHNDDRGHQTAESLLCYCILHKLTCGIFIVLLHFT